MLLLYPVSDRSPACTPYSTFHYASTLSSGSSWNANSNFLYIPLCFYFICHIHAARVDVDISLHSIMLLLYLLGHCLSLWTGRTLHSIMLLLYRQSRQNCQVQNHSTFHYASTLSLLKLLKNIWTLTLHSIMLLLYRKLEKEVQREVLLYIPLCFYFIPAWGTNANLIF